MKAPPWPAHIQAEIDIDNGRRKRTWEEQKKAFGLFAIATQIESWLEPIEVQVIRNEVLSWYEQGGTSYDELQPWMAERYLNKLREFQNYCI